MKNQEEKLGVAVEFLRKIALLNKSQQDLEGWADMTSERSYGNYDDCFYDGCTCQEARIALDCREVLKDICEATL